MYGNSLASLDDDSARKNGIIQFVAGGVSIVILIGLTILGSSPWQQFGALGIGIWVGVSFVYGINPKPFQQKLPNIPPHFSDV